jgi:NADH-quinone oxidoreductase subunit E
MACLAIVQQEQGFVSKESEQEIADYLGMPPIAVHEVTTFYNMYNQRPVGKYKLNVCTNLPCQLRDGQKALHHLEKKLGIAMGETTPTACSRCSKASAWAPAPTRR